MIIHLEVSPHYLDDISYFSPGNFTFEKDGVCFTGKNKKPDQSCMLLASLPDLFWRLMRKNTMYQAELDQLKELFREKWEC